MNKTSSPSLRTALIWMKYNLVSTSFVLAFLTMCVVCKAWVVMTMFESENNKTKLYKRHPRDSRMLTLRGFILEIFPSIIATISRFLLLVAEGRQTLSRYFCQFPALAVLSVKPEWSFRSSTRICWLIPPFSGYRLAVVSCLF